MAKAASLEETVKSVARIQEFDAAKLARTEEWGTQFNFSLAVEPARRLIELFKRIPTSALESRRSGHA